MKKKILIGINSCIAAIMAFLGVSCDNNNVDIPLEYGCPYVNYEYSGQVTDEANQPLENIQIIADHIDVNGQRWQYFSIYTDAEGKYYRCRKDSKNDMRIIANDTTGTYASDTAYLTDIKNTCPEREGSGWCTGIYEIKQDFTLKKKD